MKDVLIGNKVYIRPVEREDLNQRVDWINDPEVQATLNYDYPVSRARTEKWFEAVVLDPVRRDFSVCTLDTEEYIGFCGLLDFSVRERKAELYATIGAKEFWRGGFGTDTYRVLVNYGFQELGLNRIYGYQLLHNAGAHRVVEKLKWTREGLLREDLFSHGRLVDRYLVAILREDWEANAEVYGVSGLSGSGGS